MTPAMQRGGILVIVVVLYAIKPLLLRQCRSSWLRLMAFGTLSVSAIPLIHRLSTDWDNPCVSHLSPLIGDPVIVLTVPFISFLIDAWRPDKTFFPHWKWRTPLEIMVVLPVWAALWIAVELLILGWVWI